MAEPGWNLVETPIRRSRPSRAQPTFNRGGAGWLDSRKDGLHEMSIQAYGPRMRFRVLGPLEVSAGAERIALGGPKQRSVLASLLVRPNQVVSADDLIDQLWGEDPPDTARKTLQSYVTHLRRALGPDRLEWRAPGYVLHLDPQELDAARFESLVRESRAVKGHPDRSAALYRQSLELWRGPAFADLGGDGALAAEAHRLEELRLEALEGRLAADLDAGRHAELIPELAALTREHPLRERLWAHLIVALYRSGRKADASAAFHHAREVLAEELGLDPSEELQGLHERILKNDPALEAPHERLRGYELVEEIGEGAFGVVYRAWAAAAGARGGDQSDPPCPQDRRRPHPRHPRSPPPPRPTHHCHLPPYLRRREDPRHNMPPSPQ
jgi:DNA-binding SARP family transcriptional activator